MKTNFFKEDLAVKEDSNNVLPELVNTLPFNKKQQFPLCPVAQQ